MIRKIIHINEEKCNGCGACATACHEGAIVMVDGKAKLLRDDYCDGLGNCLPACPTEAITFVEREAAPFNEEAVKAAQQGKNKTMPSGCPGANIREISREESLSPCQSSSPSPSRLSQWPVQIQLVPVNAPYFHGANLLIAADCTAFAYGNFHDTFISNHVTHNGCTKLDDVDYSEKLTAIIKENDIKSVKIVRMEVPCCSGLENAAKTAIQNSGKFIPWQVVIVTTDGRLSQI